MGRPCRTSFRLSNVRTRIFSLQTKLVDHSQWVWRHWRTTETPFWLQPSVVYTFPFTPRIWRTTTQAHALLEVPATAIVIEFFLHLVAMEWILVIFLRIQRKSMKEDACKGLRSNGATRCLQIFGENPHTNGFHEFILFCCKKIFCSWRRSTVTDGEGVKTTPQKTRFRSVNKTPEDSWVPFVCSSVVSL